MGNSTKSYSEMNHQDSVLTIILIDDDVNVCESFKEQSLLISDINFISITNNANKALTDIYSLQPDVIILELELHNGIGSGFELLKSLKENPPDKSPYILICTKNASSLTYDYARALGADFIQFKGQKNYSEAEVLHFLQILKSTIHKSYQNLTTSNKSILISDSSICNSQTIQHMIRRELDKLEMNSTLKGYQYLIDGIQLYINSQHKNICIRIAEKYNVSASSVERAIETAIHTTWTKTTPTILTRHYTGKLQSQKGSPTIKEFISYYARKIELSIID